jgi:hypothetical protein
MEHRPQIAFGDAKHRAYLIAWSLVHFAEAKDSGHSVGKLVEAVVEGLKKLA